MFYRHHLLLLVLALAPAFAQPTNTSVSPSSGSGLAQTFTSTASSPNGGGHISSVEAFFGWAGWAEGSCLILYYSSSNAFYVGPDVWSGTWSNPITPGSNTSASDSQCTLNGAGSSATVVGNSLVLNVSITFASGFVGPQQSWMMATDAAGLYSPWQQMGTWTAAPPPHPSALPQAVSVTPNMGQGMSAVFGFVASDQNGEAYMPYAELAIGPLSGPNCTVVVYHSGGEGYLIADNGSWLAIPAGGVSNNECTVSPPLSSPSGEAWSGAGNNWNINIPVTFKPSFAGPQPIYLWASDHANQASGWQQLGTWTVGTDPVTVSSVTPSSGLGVTQTFQFHYTDAAGASDLSTLWALFSPALSYVSSANSCLVSYNLANNNIQLLNDAGTAWASQILGSAGTLSNSQCSLNVQLSSFSASGNDAYLILVLTFASGFAGSKGIYAYASGNAGSSYWQSVGSWTVQANPITVTSMSPNSGMGTSQTFQFHYSDTTGSSDLNTLWAYFIPTSNPAASANFCMVYYARASNQINLLNDAGTAWTSQILGSAGTLSNSQCSVNVQSATVTSSGNDAYLTMAFTFTTSFGGVKSAYGYASGYAGSSNWQTLGSWTIPVSQPPANGPVSPSSGSGLTQTFTLTASSPNGGGYISNVEAFFAWSGWAEGSCLILYYSNSNAFYVGPDVGSGTWSNPITPGSNTSASDSQCTLNGIGSSATVVGNNLVLNISITFAAGFVGPQQSWMMATDAAGLYSPWQQMGTWTAAPPPYPSALPQAVSVTPSAGQGMSAAFGFLTSDQNGEAYMPTAVLAIGSTSGPNCQIYVYHSGGEAYLLSDDRTTWIPVVSGGTSNGQCTITPPTSTPSGEAWIGAGNSWNITVPVTFKPAFVGSRAISMYTYDRASQGSGWQQFGTWTVQLAGNPGANTQTYNTDGGFTWTAPTGVTHIQIECWGGGGSGGGGDNAWGGGGGGGGAYARVNSYPVTPGTQYTGVVQAAGNSSFGSCLAYNGNDGSDGGHGSGGSGGGGNSGNGDVVLTGAAGSSGDFGQTGGGGQCANGGPGNGGDGGMESGNDGGPGQVVITWTPQVATPTFTPAAGAYSSAQSVSISTTTSGATIRYTTDNSTPSETNGIIYSGPVTVGSTETLKAIAYETNWYDSTVASGSYIITPPAATPTFGLAPGTYTAAQSVSLSTTTGGASMRYTTDGSTPTETNGIVYSGPITLGTTPNVATTTTIKAIAYKSGMPDSAVASATYTITGTVSTPVFTPPGGTYTAQQSVAISTPTAGSTIRYTIDNTTPSETHGTVYSGAITLTAQNTTIQAIAYKSAWTDSAIASAAYYYTSPTGGGGSGGPGNGNPNGDSGNGLDPRRVGVRNFGAYWGAAGEQIDTTSGNLNFSLPLLKILSRGWSIGAMLNYNSQMWRQDSVGSWLMGYDVGYGLGWQLQIGALVPVWGTSQIDHYIYIDSTGAQYSLSVNNGGIWTSVEGIFISYDSNANRIYANDGSFRVMGCTSAGGEQDAGVMYPTVLEDSNGNQVVITYQPGSGSGGVSNTSARIQAIVDPRAAWPSYNTYSFTYSNETVPHLLSIYGPPGESYSFTYTASQPVNSPFDSTSFGSADVLQSVAVISLGAAHSFTYATGSGEMLSVTTPMGGTLGWTYGGCLYSGSISLREVTARSMSATFANSWSFTHDDNCSGSQTYHVLTTVADSGAATSKKYTAGTPITGYVVPVGYDEVNHDGSRNLHKDFGWIQDGYGNVYMNSVITTLSPGTASAVQSKTVQTLDAYGNLTQSQVYDYGNLNTPARTYNNTYLGGANYIPRYIRNRLTQSSVTTPGGTVTPVMNSYDTTCPLFPWATTCNYNGGTSTTIPLHDTAYDQNFWYRGNLTASSSFGANYTYNYQTTGVKYSATDATGATVTTTSTDGTYSLPTVLTPNGNNNLATSLSYASFWAVSSVTGPNGATASTTYDSFGRPLGSTSSDGAVTNYTYSFSPNIQTATITAGSTTQWKKTFLDGFGRVTSVQTGHDGTTVNIVDTLYAPCACSPLGKMSQVSLPYAPGSQPVYTTYTYDGSGRTLTVTKPDGASTTRYVYSGNNTTITDPAGKWKTNTTDANGNLTTVTEPDPNNLPNGTLATNYTYNSLNQLTQVTMPRTNGTQIRTFQWTGSDLISATNPENGTVTYQYDGAHHVKLRTDAKGQQTAYTYDNYGRLTLVQHYTPGSGQMNEQSTQDVNYYYDTNPFNGSYSQNAWGRLTAVTFGAMGPFLYNSTYYMSLSPLYMYSYNQAGRVTDQHFQIVQNYTRGDDSTFDFDAAYTWDNQGRMTARNGPDANYSYTYDNMGRLSTMTGGASATAQYNAAGQITSLNYGFTETRTYNTLMQLTRQTVGPVMDMQYIYSATQNNGRIIQSIDNVAGETVNYTYDPLNRLASAIPTSGLWSQQYTYDGFGNLTGTNGAAVWSFDPGTNRTSGGNYDANGLPGGQTSSLQYWWQYNVWDVENRLVQASGYMEVNQYGYDPYGKRVFQLIGEGGPGGSTPQVFAHFYSISGQKLATIQCFPGWSTMVSSNVYFGSKLIRSNGVTVATDRLGSVRGNSNGERMSYYPYGQERTSTADLREKFGTYFRDGPGQDYADQRYYNQQGSFWTPDPGGIKTADPTNPGSWNRYGYAYGDPINYYDPKGLFAQIPQQGPATGYNPSSGDPGSGGGGGGDTSGMQIENGNDGGGGGGGAADPTVSDARMQQELQRALALAQKMLARPQCDSLFGLPLIVGGTTVGPTPDPSLVLDQISGSFTFGNILASAPNTVTSATTAGSGNATIPIGNDASVNVNTSVTITLNNTSDGASFVSGNTYAQAITILHELGHAYWNLYGPGTSQIQPDGTSVQQSIDNTNLVKKDCR